MPNVVYAWTREEVLALPDDGNRYELVDGELLVTPAPRGRHQRAVGLLYRVIADFVDDNGIGTAGFSPADLALDGDQLVQPDLFVGGLVGGKEPIEWSDYRVPLLVVEVLSPSTARQDRLTKRRKYQRSGVPEYWIVDVEARAIERWRPGADQAEAVTGSIEWRPLEGPALVIDLDWYFDRVWVQGPTGSG